MVLAFLLEKRFSHSHAHSVSPVLFLGAIFSVLPSQAGLCKSTADVRESSHTWASVRYQMLLIHSLDLILKVFTCHQIGDIIVILAVRLLILLHVLIALGELAEGCERVRAQLVEDARNKLCELLVLAVAIDCEGVCLHRSMNYGDQSQRRYGRPGGVNLQEGRSECGYPLERQSELRCRQL